MSRMSEELENVQQRVHQTRFWCRLGQELKRFAADSRGAAILIIGLAIVPLALAVGLVVDSARSYTAHNRLQAAVDAAALAGAKSADTDEDAIENEASMFFDSNYPNDYLGGGLTSFNAVFDEDSGEITVTAEVLLPTTFLRVAGKDNVTINATASALTQSSGLELALVVDVTGSMDQTVGGVKKIESLKTAAVSLLDVLYGESDLVEDLFISLVPYSGAVNIGPDRVNFVTGLSQGDFSPETWGGCVEARDDGLDQTDDLPTGSAGKFPPYNFRRYNEAFFPFFGDSGNLFCPDEPITPLESSRQVIEDKVNALNASGATLTNIGMVWGWRSLSPVWRGKWGNDVPNDRPLDYDDEDNIKAIVFMTDGLASVFDYTAYGLRSEERLGTSNFFLANQEVDNRLLTVCNSMKDQDIEVFTIMFDLNSPTVETLYRDCATSDEHFFDSPTGEDLEFAFKKIGRQLTNLRLSR